MIANLIGYLRAPSFIKVGGKRCLWLLGVYLTSRVFFLFYNRHLFQGDSISDISHAFLHGVSFDISALFITNSILLLLWMAPEHWLAKRSVAFFDRLLFAAINFICIGTNYIDAEFIRFTGKRLSFEYLRLHEDIEQQSIGLLLVYWPLFLTTFVSVAIPVWFYPKFSSSSKREAWLTGAAWRIAVAALVVLGVRGGFGFKPIHPMDAFQSTKSELGLLTLNSPFNIIKTRRSGEIVTQNYFSNHADAVARVLKMTTPSREPLGVAKNFNVVVLLVESLSTEDMGAPNNYKGYTPFLDELAKKSFFFPNNFANSRRSIEGVPAVFCGIPGFMGEALIMSEFIYDRLDCFPKLLKPHGYTTYFLHGAHNGSMHFDTFANIVKFDHFIGLNEFPYKTAENLDEAWGVLDDPMLQYAIELIDEAPKPVFMGVFTLSSHTPYYIPPPLRGKFPKGDNEIHESMGYTDYSLRHFFEVASKKAWFDKTIFVITGDHVHPSRRPEYMTSDQIGFYRVPLIIYAPGLKEIPLVDSKRITQHIDTLPSVLDLLGIERADRFLLGQSVFDLGLPGRAYNYGTGAYWYLDSTLYARYDRMQRKGSIFDRGPTGYDVLRKMPEDQSAQMEQILNLTAIAQYFNEGILNNSLYEWKQALRKSDTPKQ
jgi:uncharacterized sulfatase